VAITLDLYSHVTPTMQTEAAQLIDELLTRRDGLAERVGVSGGVKPA
jgi:hypothetical protein